MTILGVAVTGILTTFSAAMIATKVSEDYSIVSNLMGELRTQLRADMLDPTLINEGTFTNHPEFTWNANFLMTDVENLYQVDLAIHWKRGNRDYQVQYVTYHYYYPVTEEEEIEA